MSRVAVTVRPARLRDVAALASIQVESWEVAYRGKLPDAVIDARHHDARVTAWWAILGQPWRISDPIHRCWIAAVDERPAAFVDVGRPRKPTPGLADPLEIYACYCAPWAWRCGAGRALWTHVLDHAAHHHVAHAMLWVLADNRRALAFYEAMGLALDGELEDVEMAGECVPHARMSGPLALA